MDITSFSILDVREQGHKSYVASYCANEESMIPGMFSRELRQWKRFAKDFLRKRFPIYSSLLGRAWASPTLASQRCNGLVYNKLRYKADTLHVLPALN